MALDIGSQGLARRPELGIESIELAQVGADRRTGRNLLPDEVDRDAAADDVANVAFLISMGKRAVLK